MPPDGNSGSATGITRQHFPCDRKILLLEVVFQIFNIVNGGGAIIADNESAY